MIVERKGGCNNSLVFCKKCEGEGSINIGIIKESLSRKTQVGFSAKGPDITTCSNQAALLKLRFKGIAACDIL